MAVRTVRALLRDSAAASLLRAGLTRPARWARDRLTIVTFHRVLPDELRRQYPLPGLCVSPDELDWVLGVLQRHFRCGTLCEAIDGFDARPTGAPPFAAITFDDAQLDNHRYAAPILARRGVHATFFAPTDAIERGEVLWHDRLAYGLIGALIRDEEATRRFLAEAGALAELAAPRELASALLARAKQVSPKERQSWAKSLESLAGGPQRPHWDGMMGFRELAELAEGGHEIGSHSASHALLPQCSAAELEQELRGSRSVLRDRLGLPIDSFCYPNGDRDDRCEQAVALAGYRAAVTTRWGTNPHTAPRLALDRCDIHPDHLRDRNGALCEARLLWRLSGLHPGLANTRG